MRVAVDAREWTGHGRTGIGRYLENLLTPLLATQPDLSFVFFVHDPRAVPAAVALSRQRVAPLPAWPTLLVDQWVLPRLARRAGADVFFSPYYKIPLRGRFRRVITVHDIMFLRLPGMGPMRKALVRLQLRAACRRADTILVDSDFTGRDLAQEAPSARDRIRTLHPDLGPEWFEPLPPEAAAEARERFAGGRPFFLYVGNFKPHKNVDMLVRAFARLRDAGKAGNRCLLLVGGDAANARRIESLAASVGKGEGDCKVWGFVTDKELRALYAAADWFVTASAYEGFGYPVVEAMACKCPVICHRSTSLAEVAGTEVLKIDDLSPAGLLAALESAAGLADSERGRMIAQGVRNAHRFKPGSAGAHFLGMLESLG